MANKLFRKPLLFAYNIGQLGIPVAHTLTTLGQ